MEFLFIYILFAAIVGAIGSDRAMGFWGVFLLSILLSPLIGLLIAMLAKSKKQQDYENQIAYNQVQQTQALHKMNQQQPTSQTSVADEIAKLKQQMDDGIITQDEFQKLKSKLIA